MCFRYCCQLLLVLLLVVPETQSEVDEQEASRSHRPQEHMRIWAGAPDESSYDFSGYPKLEVCMDNWAKLKESDLPPKGVPPTLVFIKYPSSNILEPMFFHLKNISTKMGFEVIRNFETIGRDIKFRIVVNYEEPNGMFIENNAGSIAAEQAALEKREQRYHHSFSMCPDTVQWVNTRIGGCHRTPMWQAIPERLIRPYATMASRRYDIMYMSHASTGGPVREALTKVFPKYKYRWVTSKKWNFGGNGQLHATDFHKSLKTRLRVTARSRMALILNGLFFSESEGQMQLGMGMFQKRPILDTHPAFAQFSNHARGGKTPVPQYGEPMLTIPQMKSRTFEAAMCGALMMVFNDGSNIIERYYEPDTEFIYWYNHTDLQQKMDHVIANPEAYDPIAYRAYAKTKRLYTVDHWVETLMMPFVRASQRP